MAATGLGKSAKVILVTGGNKGIGLAIVKRLLAEQADTYVLLGSRSLERGKKAAEAELKDFAERSEVVQLDVSNDASVEKAAKYVAEKFGDKGSVYGVVNNAGVMTWDSLQQTLDVNCYGAKRVIDYFLTLLKPKGGRIVNVTSAAGPMFVAKCSDTYKDVFVSKDTTWATLDDVMKECVAMGSGKKMKAKGLGDGDGMAFYGLSKAVLNTYTQELGIKYPDLVISSCTPGFIATDMTRPFAEGAGKTSQEMGMKSTHDGAACPLHLLLSEDLKGNGWFYGSDSLRSPLDRYRNPGDPEFEG